MQAIIDVGFSTLLLWHWPKVVTLFIIQVYIYILIIQILESMWVYVIEITPCPIEHRTVIIES